MGKNSSGGEAEIGARILRVSRRIAPVDEVFSFALGEGSRPAVLGAASVIGPTNERTGRYTEEFYKFDPLFGVNARRENGRITRRVISADEIRKSDYREICFDRPQLRQKISFGDAAGDERIHCNFYLREPVGDEAVDDLEAFAAIVLPALRRRWKIELRRAQSLIDRIEARLAEAYPSLTTRERQVCARTIAGWSAEASAVDLGIGAGSVLTYRRRAYSRFDYSSAGQFLERILN